jgi:hypothetical protein
MPDAQTTTTRGHQPSFLTHTDLPSILLLMTSTGRRQSQAPDGDFGEGSPTHVPITEPSDEVLDSFWERIAQLMTRTSVGDVWIGSDELLRWNRANLVVSYRCSKASRSSRTTKSCKRCTRSRLPRLCTVDPHHPNCRPCRNAKIDCERKKAFLFHFTKDQYFASYDQFLSVYDKRRKGRLRGVKQIEHDKLQKAAKEREELTASE